ncbi:MAG: hypothetical protein KatS3mg050_0821 [Litorilinea sp.]|nr:MAG: hypothetical protein KatS3mg050_0821 [Litorilinea sp.]
MATQSVPPYPKLYHITHVDNLSSILEAGGLWSDAAMIRRGGPETGIGISEIKQRRLRLPVKCQPGDASQPLVEIRREWYY